MNKALKCFNLNFTSSDCQELSLFNRVDNFKISSKAAWNNNNFLKSHRQNESLVLSHGETELLYYSETGLIKAGKTAFDSVHAD